MFGGRWGWAGVHARGRGVRAFALHGVSRSGEMKCGRAFLCVVRNRWRVVSVQRGGGRAVLRGVGESGLDSR